jgi:hypothetical protein
MTSLKGHAALICCPSQAASCMLLNIEQKHVRHAVLPGA